MRRSLFFGACVASLLGLAAPPARASNIPSDAAWNYSFTASPVFVQADKTTSNPNPGSVVFNTSGGSGITGSSNVDVANLSVSSTASPTSPDTLNTNGAWSVTMKLTDAATGQFTNLTFTGKLGGTFSNSNSEISNTLNTAPQTWTASNGDKFTVALKSFTPPGPPDPPATNGTQSPVTYGAISAHVTVTNDGTGTKSGSGTPEPSTLVLSCLGLAFAGAASWRKRRRSLALLLS